MNEAEVRAFVVAFGAGIGLFLVAGLRWLPADWPWSARLGAVVLTLLGPVLVPIVVGYPLAALIPLVVVGLGVALTHTRHPIGQSIALAAAGLSLLIVSLAEYDPENIEPAQTAIDSTPEREWTSAPAIAIGPFLQTAVASSARTDRGRPVWLGVSANPQSVHAIAEVDRARIVDLGFAERVLRVAPATEKCDCFGLVFTGGEFHLVADDVEKILTDNQYEPIADARSGDIVVYRNQGKIIHVALVISADGNSQQTLVTSKWGWTGATYVHAVGDSVFGTQFTIYRTERSGHLLAGLESKVVGRNSRRPIAE